MPAAMSHVGRRHMKTRLYSAVISISRRYEVLTDRPTDFLPSLIDFCVLNKYLLLNSIGIATVAVMVTAGREGLAYCRTDRVFADAAYVILTRDSRARTGEYLYDENVLREVGVTDFEQYSYIPGICGLELS